MPPPYIESIQSTGREVLIALRILPQIALSKDARQCNEDFCLCRLDGEKRIGEEPAYGNPASFGHQCDESKRQARKFPP
jgi:hypothetical protein